jgi:hypothetical protein
MPINTKIAHPLIRKNPGQASLFNKILGPACGTTRVHLLMGSQPKRIRRSAECHTAHRDICQRLVTLTYTGSRRNPSPPSTPPNTATIAGVVQTTLQFTALVGNRCKACIRMAGVCLYNNKNKQPHWLIMTPAWHRSDSASSAVTQLLNVHASTRPT